MTDPEIEMGDITVVSVATSKSKSLRATIPIGIVRQLKLSEGDRLRWRLKAEDNHLIVVVEPIKSGVRSK